MLYFIWTWGYNLKKIDRILEKGGFYRYDRNKN